jgi:hypothetical protein
VNRLDTMLERLPPIYGIAKGSLLHDYAAVAANHEAAYDEDMHRVQRAHWIETALDRADLGKLGALFDIPILPWEPSELYRTRLKATIAARLRGAVTRDALEYVLVRILSGVVEALGVQYMDLSTELRFHTGPAEHADQPAFIEFPPITRRSAELIARRGALTSLERFEVINRGLHPVTLSIVLRGMAGGLCMTPVLINLTNGRVMAFAGRVQCGQELRITIDRRGRVVATLNDRDVSNQVYTGGGFVPGTPFSPVVPDTTPEPLTLECGSNQMWFFPLALYSQPALNSGVLGMPSLEMRHGRFGPKSETPFTGTFFDTSLFEQQPIVVADLWWEEARPASFAFEIPAGVVRRPADAGSDPHEERLRLFDLLQQTIALMRAAGVDGRVTPRPLRERQPQRDRVFPVPVVVGTDEARVDDALSGLSALFDTNATDGSRFA